MRNEDEFWTEELSENLPICLKRKRRVGKRKLEFVGWGSGPLIEFLEAIGQDTTKEHSRHDVVAFITKYIKEKKLASAEKKKKILCDERLYALFRKRIVPRIKVFEMLEEHFAENHHDSDTESAGASEEENYRKTSSKNYTQMKKVPKTPRSCFAAIIPENIKMIHLKKSLIQELLKAPESFECKVMGSFVRIKSDPNDIYQKNRFQLQQVTGVEKVPSSGDASNEICLKVSNFFKDISIRDLSDDNFTEDEIVDLRDRIKSGMLKRLTVKEVEIKAEMLHVDITKHWIAKEIASLQVLSDRANEKGWRREFYEHQERKKKLQTPSEQEKLLQNIPEVIAEEIEPENVVATSSDRVECDNPPKSIVKDSSDAPTIVVPERRTELSIPHEQEKYLLKIPELIAEEAEPQDIVAAGPEEARNAGTPKLDVRSTSDASVPIVPETEDIAAQVQLNSNAEGAHNGDAQCFVQNGDANGSVHVQNSDGHQRAIETTPEQANEMGPHEADDAREGNLTPNEMGSSLFPPHQEMSAQPVIDLNSINLNSSLSSSHPQPVVALELAERANPQPIQVIELSDDDEPRGNAQNKSAEPRGNAQDKPAKPRGNAQDNSAEPRVNGQNNSTEPRGNGQNKHQLNPYENIWYYLDPHGQTQGPFSLFLLKRWNDCNYFPPDFMIWRTGQVNSYDAIMLTHALQHAVFHPIPNYSFHPF